MLYDTKQLTSTTYKTDAYVLWDRQRLRIMLTLRHNTFVTTP